MENFDEKKPRKVICPEGIWIPNLLFEIGEKLFAESFESMKAGKIADVVSINLLMEPELEIFTISSYNGSKDKFNRSLLRGDKRFNYIAYGYIPFGSQFSFDDDEELSGEYIFINKKQIETLLSGKKFQKEVIINSNKASEEKYIPPYMALMLRAVEALKLTPDSRANKDLITEWLDTNWPVDLDGKSDRLIESMATLIRRPEDKKGGNRTMK